MLFDAFWDHPWDHQIFSLWPSGPSGPSGLLRGVLVQQTAMQNGGGGHTSVVNGEIGDEPTAGCNRLVFMGEPLGLFNEDSELERVHHK